MQSVVIDPLDRLWILDTGRVLLPDGSQLVSSSYGGPKLVGLDLATDKVFQTILFPQTVAYPDSYLNDVRFDLRPNITQSGKGVAYITDSSAEGRNGIVVVDLGTGESWRHLDLDRSVRSEPQFLPFVWGVPFYSIPHTGAPYTSLSMGSDGIAISADGDELYYGPIGSRYLYSVPTALLRDRSQTSELMAMQGVRSHGQKGVSDGFETDSNGLVYMGNMENNGIVTFNPSNGTVEMFVRDPRISWADTSKCFGPERLSEMMLTWCSVRRNRWIPILHKQPAEHGIISLPRSRQEGSAIRSLPGEASGWRDKGFPHWLKGILMCYKRKYQFHRLIFVPESPNRLGRGWQDYASLMQDRRLL